MTDNNPIPDTGASTAPATDAIVSNLDAEIDAIFKNIVEPMASPAEQSPEADIEVEESMLEDSGDYENNPEGGSDTDAGESEEGTEGTSENTSEIVDWDEMKDFAYQIDGKTYSAGDLKAALGRQTKQEQARTEVEDARRMVETERSQVTELTKSLKQRQELMQYETQLTSFGNHINSLEARKEEARKSGNVDEYTRLNMEVEPMKQQFHNARRELDNRTATNQHNNLSMQKSILQDKGYGDVLADTQRRNALSDYISDSYSENTLGTVTMDAELIILAEKARLYDKAQSGIPKSKLKGSGRTLKGGVAKSRPKNAKPVDRVQSVIDKAFDGI